MTILRKHPGALRLAGFAGFLALVSLTLAQGNSAPVVAEDLVGAKFNHYYDAQMKAVSPPDFAWTFTRSNLVIQATTGAIPADLLGLLAGDRKDVKTIEAGWKVEAGELVITGIRLDGQPTRTLAKLPVGRTAPTVIRIGKHQYVFVPAK
jgi:hypothetical protein